MFDLSVEFIGKGTNKFIKAPFSDFLKSNQNWGELYA